MRQAPIITTGWIPPDTSGGGTGWQPPIVIGGGGGIYTDPDIVPNDGGGIYTLPTPTVITPVVVPMVTGQTQTGTQTQTQTQTQTGTIPQPPQGQENNRPTASLQQAIKDNPHLALIGGAIALFLILRK